LEYKTLVAKRDQEVHKLRKKHKIKIEGDFPADTFAESFDKMKRIFNMSEQMLGDVSQMGYNQPTPV
jgi:hypothetical protein